MRRSTAPHLLPLALASVCAVVVAGGCEEKQAPVPTTTPPGSGGSMLDGVKAGAEDAAQQAKDAAAGATDAVKGAAASAAEAMEGSAQDLRDRISALSDKAGASSFLQGGLDSVKTQLASLREKAANAPASVKPMVDSLLQQADAQVNAVAAKVGELKNAPADGWKQIVADAQPALEKLQELIRELKAKLG